MMTKTFLSTEANTIFDAMGNGMRLIVPRENERVSDDPSIVARLIPHPKWQSYATTPLDLRNLDAIKELLASGLIRELPENTVIYRKAGPKSKVDGGLIGWRESGLPGESFHVYACTQ